MSRSEPPDWEKAEFHAQARRTMAGDRAARWAVAPDQAQQALRPYA